MNTPAKLSQLMMALELPSEEYQNYFDRQTGRVVMAQDAILSALEEGDDEVLADLVEEGNKEMEVSKAIANDNGSRFLSLPDQFDFNEYEQMERFISSLKNKKAAEQLWRAINGRGAFRHFKDTIHSLGIQDQWYQFRDEAMKQFIMEWAEENDVLLEDDTHSPNK